MNGELVIPNEITEKKRSRYKPNLIHNLNK